MIIFKRTRVKGLKTKGMAMNKYFYVFMTFIFLLTANLSSASKNVEINPYGLSVDVNIVGAEAAAKELASAMTKVTISINKALMSDKLSEHEKKELLAILSSFKGIKDNFKMNLSDARAPINNIVKDASSEVTKAVEDMNEKVVEPLVFKFQLLFYILILVIILLVMAIMLFIKFYILASLNRVATSAENLGNALEALPNTVETIIEKSQYSQSRFKRNLKRLKRT